MLHIIMTKILFTSPHLECLQYCPICRLLPGGGPSYYIRNFIRHLQLRHTFYYEDYIVSKLYHFFLIPAKLYLNLYLSVSLSV